MGLWLWKRIRQVPSSGEGTPETRVDGVGVVGGLIASGWTRRPRLAPARNRRIVLQVTQSRVALPPCTKAITSTSSFLLFLAGDRHD